MSNNKWVYFLFFRHEKITGLDKDIKKFIGVYRNHEDAVAEGDRLYRENGFKQAPGIENGKGYSYYIVEKKELK